MYRMTSVMSSIGHAAFPRGVLVIIGMKVGRSISEGCCLIGVVLTSVYWELIICFLGYRLLRILMTWGVLIATGVSDASLLIALLYWSLLAASCALLDLVMLFAWSFLLRFSCGIRFLTLHDIL